MQFMTLAMRDEGSRDDIVARRGSLIALIAAGGLEGDGNTVDWRLHRQHRRRRHRRSQRREAALSAEQVAAAAEDYNANVDVARDSLLAFLPTDKVPGPLGPLQDRLLDEVTGRYLHRPTDQVDGAEHQVNLTVSEIFESQRLILAEADLIVSVRAMEAGTADKARCRSSRRLAATSATATSTLCSLRAAGEDVEVPRLSG
jgi:hypothetical protein